MASLLFRTFTQNDEVQRKVAHRRDVRNNKTRNGKRVAGLGS